MRYENSKLFSNFPCVVLMFTIGLLFSKTCLLANSLNPSLLFVVSCSRWHICYVTNFHFGRKNVPCARCCATPISSRNRCKPYKPWSNSNSMHVDVLHKTEQRFIAFLISYASCTCVCDMSPLQARCCATPISSRNRCKPYKLDRIATACMLMCCIRQNSVLLLFW